MLKNLYEKYSLLLLVTSLCFLSSCSSVLLNENPNSFEPSEKSSNKSKNSDLKPRYKRAMKNSVLKRAPQISNLRMKDRAVIVRENPYYDYVPSVMKERNKYRMWWCGNADEYTRGDNIMYAESFDLQGPWTTAMSVFKTSGKTGAFDTPGTCDPSVIRVGSTYYMYYAGGIGRKGNANRILTQIGVAKSTNGIEWERMNNGNPILVAAMKENTGNLYGAGQPSAVYLEGYFYIIYTDTTGTDSNSNRGAAQYVVRSKSPDFENYEVLTKSGFVPKTDENQTEYSVFDTASVDMMYSDILKEMIVATHTKQNFTTLYNLNINTFETTRINIDIPGSKWRDGPGLVRSPEGHTIPSLTPGLIPVDIFSAGGGDPKNPRTWDLFWSGADLQYDDN